MAPQTIAWPNPDYPKKVEQLITEFYSLADSKDVTTPERFAALFAEDGVMYGLAGLSTGRAGMSPVLDLRHDPLPCGDHSHPVDRYNILPEASDHLSTSPESSNHRALSD
jgi:hypothetical protein